MPENQDRKRFSAVDPSRRVFIMKYTALAFATPLIASFALDGVASAATGADMGSQRFPNQFQPNQCFPNQKVPTQHLPNQHFPNQHLPNQCDLDLRPWFVEDGKHP
jgi:hypothetical protein